MSTPHRPTDRVEWPTLMVIVALWAALAGVVIVHRLLPWPITVVLLGVLGALHVSLQHEVLHGHPTPWQRCNEALVYIPTILWLPYPDYRDSHRLHHRVVLTTPGVDPESHFVDQATWDRASAWWRVVLRANRTLLGRMVIWPGVAMLRTLRRGVGDIRRLPAVRRRWATHVVASAASLWLICVVGGLPWWQYVLGFTYGGLSLTYLRSFAEHLPVPTGSRSAMVHAAPPWALMFLNNNLHHTHHAEPDVAWYRLPALAVQLDSDRQAAAGAGLYRGYLDVARKFLVRPIAGPVHPGREFLE